MSRKTDAITTCDSHPEKHAVFQCENCLRLLCHECVTKEAHLFFCRHCGRSAVRIQLPAREQPSAIKEISLQLPLFFSRLSSSVVNHVVLPIAIIAMVSAFLFYLLDIQSVFLGSTLTLKWIGFFFVMATVLIARYGKVHAIEERQNIYTVLMALATLRAMMMYSPGFRGFLANIAVVSAVWWFATRVTNNLDMGTEDETNRWDSGERSMFGVERLEYERMEKKHNLNSKLYRYQFANKLSDGEAIEKKQGPNGENKKKSIWGIRKGKGDAHGNPVRSIAPLAMFAIVTFAVGEPIILSGPPGVGQQALIAVIVFLLSTGIVLSAASSLGIDRHTKKLGGQTSYSLIPIKIVVSLVLLITLLAAGLAIPGIKYTGSGRLNPGLTDVEKKGFLNLPVDGENPKVTPNTPTNPQQVPNGNNQSQPSSTNHILSFFTSMSKWFLLIIAVVIFLAVFIVLIKLSFSLKHIGSGLSNAIDRWKNKLKSLLKKLMKVKDREKAPSFNILNYLSKLGSMEPREGILTAYRCLLAFYEKAGYPKAERLTPYEFLSSLPDSLEPMTKYAEKVTNVYVKTAYSGVSPSIDECEEALLALFEIDVLLKVHLSKIANIR